MFSYMKNKNKILVIQWKTFGVYSMMFVYNGAKGKLTFDLLRVYSMCIQCMF